MKIVIAPDSFKGSLTSKQAGETMKSACLKLLPNAEIVVLPMADGGEGTLETILFSTNGIEVDCLATGPIGKSVQAKYGVLAGKKTAVIEAAKIAGLTMVPPNRRNPFKATTYGIGETIKHALDQGIRSFIIGLGGSATNDGGLGMLTALGAAFLDNQDNSVGLLGEDLLSVHSVSFKNLDPRLKECTFKIASDVDNPLCGPNGATYVFGPQKGADSEQLELLDKALHRYAVLIEKELGKEFRNYPGAGAAGGLGFAFLSIGGVLESGAKLAAEAVQLEVHLARADLLLTGEGQSDFQTMFGKAPGYAARLAKAKGVDSILISGSLGEGYEQLYEWFAGCFSITKGPISLEECMENSRDLLYAQTYNVLHFYLKK